MWLAQGVGLPGIGWNLCSWEHFDFGEHTELHQSRRVLCPELHHSLTCLSWHLRQFMTCHGYVQRYKIKQNCSFLQNICLPYVAVIGQFPEEFIIKPGGIKEVSG